MAINLNLLPQEYSVKKGIGAILRVSRSLTIVIIVLFLIFVIGASAFFLISSLSLRNINANVESLKTQVKSQETTEQRLVLLKDRLTKIKAVKDQISLAEDLGNIEPVLGSISGGSVSELNVDSSKTEASIIFSNSAGLTSFFENLAGSKSFKSIVMTSFGFNPIAGYLTSLRFTGK